MADEKDKNPNAPSNEAGCYFPIIEQREVNKPGRKTPSLEVCDLGNSKNDGPHNARNDSKISRLRNSEAGIYY